MFDIHCHHCQKTYLVGTRAISSMHTTSEGPVAYVTCPKGHHLVRYFRDKRTEVLHPEVLRPEEVQPKVLQPLEQAS